MSFDEDWFGDGCNTWHEEQKQMVYASRMGLLASWNCAHPPTYNLGGRSVVDIGGGPVSLLLKCTNFERAVVADPGIYPYWVQDRYIAHGVDYWASNGEDLDRAFLEQSFDEAWIYNCLQHVIDPSKVIANARKISKTIRIFEWIDIEPYEGHPHKLTEDSLNEWLGSYGFSAHVNESGAVGKAYYGVMTS